MKYFEFSNAVRSGKLQQVYYFNGEEAGLIDEGVNLLLEKLVTPATRDFNFDVFYAGEVPARRILDIARSYPMTAPHRTVLVREVNKMAAGDLAALAAYCKTPSPTTYLILTQREKSAGKKGLDTLRRNCTVVECRPLYDNQIVPWIQEYGRRKGMEIAPEAAQLLATEVGSSIHALRSELEKVALYLGEQRRILPEHVQEVAGARREFSVYSLQDALGARNLPAALRIVEQLAVNTSSSAIIASLARYFNHLYLAKALPKRQEAQLLAEKTGVHAFFVERLQRAAAGYTVEAILNAFEVLHHADYLAKSQNLPATLLLRVMIIAIVRQLPSRYMPFPRNAAGALA